LGFAGISTLLQDKPTIEKDHSLWVFFILLIFVICVLIHTCRAKTRLVLFSLIEQSMGRVKRNSSIIIG